MQIGGDVLESSAGAIARISLHRSQKIYGEEKLNSARCVIVDDDVISMGKCLPFPELRW